MSDPATPDFVAAVAAESQAFLTAAGQAAAMGGGLDTAVPACPDWSFADLVWHLTEVQHFWAAMVGDGLAGPEEYERPERPSGAGPELLDFFERCSERLVTVLAGTDPAQACWSWHPDGHHVGWVRRRQAQEALVHRIDAEQTLVAAGGGPVPNPIDQALAADGVDEILRGMLDVGAEPDWGEWMPDGALVRLVADLGSAGPEHTWDLALGRVVGPDPSGVHRDLPALHVRPPGGTAGPDATVRGAADVVDLWLWGRAPLEALDVDGEADAARSLRLVAEVQ